MKVNGVTDTKLFCRIKKLSILKKQVKNALNEVRRYVYSFFICFLLFPKKKKRKRNIVKIVQCFVFYR